MLCCCSFVIYMRAKAENVLVDAVVVSAVALPVVSAVGSSGTDWSIHYCTAYVQLPQHAHATRLTCFLNIYMR